MSPTEFASRCYERAGRYVRADAVVFVLAVIATAVPQILANAWLDDRDAMRISAVLGLVQLYVNLLVTYRTLDHTGAAPPGYRRADLTEARFPSAFLMSLLSTLAIVVGLILLVVPGVLLTLLWSLALPVIAARRARGVEALRISWRLARPALGRLALVWAPLLAAIAAAVLIVAGVAAVLPSSDLVISIALNPAISFALPFMASVWTFAYLALRDAPAT